MPSKTTLIAGGLAAASVLMATGAANAFPARATGSVHVRSGPSIHYRIVDALRPGEPVDIRNCRGGWCYVTHRGPDGWVSASFLSRGGRYRAPYTPPPVYHRPPPPHWGWRHHRWHHHHPRPAPGFCLGNPRASVCINP